MIFGFHPAQRSMLDDRRPGTALIYTLPTVRVENYFISRKSSSGESNKNNRSSCLILCCLYALIPLSKICFRCATKSVFVSRPNRIHCHRRCKPKRRAWSHVRIGMWCGWLHVSIWFHFIFFSRNYQIRRVCVVQTWKENSGRRTKKKKTTTQNCAECSVNLPFPFDVITYVALHNSQTQKKRWQQPVK